MPQCKSIGCDNQVSKLGTDFCDACGYIHSIFGLDDMPEMETPQTETVELDTYIVHQAFNIQDPSSCLHRASRIILMSGQMNEESEYPKGSDIIEARNMLNRWLELNGHV